MSTMKDLVERWESVGVRDAQRWLSALYDCGGKSEDWCTVGEQVRRAQMRGVFIHVDLVQQTEAFIATRGSISEPPTASDTFETLVAEWIKGGLSNAKEWLHALVTRDTSARWDSPRAWATKYNSVSMDLVERTEWFVASRGVTPKPYEPPTVTEVNPKEQQRVALDLLHAEQIQQDLTTLRQVTERVSTALLDVARQHDMAIDAVEYARMLLSKIQPALDVVQEQVTKSNRQKLDLETSAALVPTEQNGLVTDLAIEE